MTQYGLLIALNLGVIAIVGALLVFGGPPHLRRKLASPALVPFAMMLFMLADFVTLGSTIQSGSAAVLRDLSVGSYESFIAGFEIYTIYAALFALFLHIGFARGGWYSRQITQCTAPRVAASPAARQGAALAAAACFALAAFGLFEIVVYGMNAGSIFYVSMTRQLFYRDNPALWLVMALVVPGCIVTAILMLHRSLWWVAVLVAGTLFLLIAGTRSQIMVLVLTALVLACVVGRRPGVAWLFVGLPILPYLLAVLQYVQREWYQYDSMAAMLSAQGGAFNRMFATSEIAFAEIFSIIASGPVITRYPFESVLGILVFPFPRSWLSWKPVPPSSEFTAAVTPDSWYEFGSELTMSGFANIHIEFGWAGLVPLAAIAFLLGFALVRASKLHTIIQVLQLIYCQWMVFAFLRNDLTNLSFIVWPLAIFSAIWFCGAKLVTLLRTNVTPAQRNAMGADVGMGTLRRVDPLLRDRYRTD